MEISTVSGKEVVMTVEEDDANEEVDDSACTMPNYLQVAHTLQGRLHSLARGDGEASELKRILDIVAEEFDIPGGDYASGSGSKVYKRRRMSQDVAVMEDQSATCKHACFHHEELMNPNLWGTLPHELLQMVFSRLPLPELQRLRCLSRDWRMAMATLDSDCNALHPDFFRVCGEAYPRLFAFIRHSYSYPRLVNEFKITVFDIISKKWYTSQICLRHGQELETTSASDGGLVCLIFDSLRGKTKRERRLREGFVEECKNPYFHVVVANPLTRSSKELARFQNDPVAVHMVQIKVDRQAKSYKVLVVGDWGDAGGVIMQGAQVYDSQTGAWTGAENLQDVFIGTRYYWCDFKYSGRRDYPCAFDCAEGRLIELDGDNSPCTGPTVKSYALDKDALYVLHLDKDGESADEAPIYYILEYHFQMRAKAWERVRTHSCSHFEHPSKAEYELQLTACNGFLIVVANLFDRVPYRDRLSWIYDLKTRKWSHLPTPPNMWWIDDGSELQWDIHPYGQDILN